MVVAFYTSIILKNIFIDHYTCFFTKVLPTTQPVIPALIVPTKAPMVPPIITSNDPATVPIAAHIKLVIKDLMPLWF